MPPIHVPENRPGLQIPVPPPYDPRDPRNELQYTPQETAPDTQADSGFVTYVVDNSTGPDPAQDSVRQRLAFAENTVRALALPERLGGWDQVLHQEFSGVAGALESLPADEQGNAFHATFGQRSGEKAMVFLKIWYGQAANPKSVAGAPIAMVQINDADKVLVDCLDTTMGPGMPRLDYHDRLADLVLDAPESLAGWAAKASGRGPEARRAVRQGFAPV